jgi:HPt (histidine-containing phosphotransfer) domain-containing protein
MSYVNLNYLHELSGNDKDFEKIMMEQFVQQTPSEITSLQTAIEAKDWLSAKKIAHSLKSTVSYMGLADELHPSLQDIEKAAVSDDPSSIPVKFAHVKQVSEEAVKEIEGMLQAS